MIGRNSFLEQLTESLNGMLVMIEDREAIDSDLAIVRELAEQMMEEVESLSEDT